MIIQATLTIPAVDTGYSLTTLLANAGVTGIPITRRVAELQLFADPAETDTVFGVAREGAITTTVGNTPDQYGFLLTLTGAGGSQFSSVVQSSRQPINQISLDEICVAADAANTVFHLFAYSV